MIPSEIAPAAGTTLRRALGRTAAIAASAMTALVVLTVAGPGAARAATDPHFVPEATSVTWTKGIVTVTFQEVEVEFDATVISFAVTGELEALCTRGESTIVVRKSSKATDVHEFSVDEDGTITGTVELPLEVKKPSGGGYSCAVSKESVTVVLEDFFTGAMLVHPDEPRPID